MIFNFVSYGYSSGIATNAMRQKAITQFHEYECISNGLENLFYSCINMRPTLAHFIGLDDCPIV